MGNVLAALRERGVTFIIARCPNIYDAAYNAKVATFEAQVRDGRAGGFEVAAYWYPYFGRGVAYQFGFAVPLLATLGIAEVWPDVEEAYNEGIGSQTVVADLHAIFGLMDANGLSGGVYARQSSWEGMTGTSHEFADRWLWDADYDWQADLGGFAPYGGWGNRRLKQYGNDVAIERVTFDLNIGWR